MIYWQSLAGKIHLKLTDHQKHIVQNAKRFNVVVGGKRVGKTVLVAFLALLELWKTDRTVWVVAPTYDLGERIFNKIVPWLTRYMGDMIANDVIKTYKTPGRVAIENTYTRSRIEFKSANTETSLKGEGLDMVIIDEAGDIDPLIWQEYLLPNIREIRPSGELGKAFLIGNANYFGSWWHSMLERGDRETFVYNLPTIIKKGEHWVSNNPDIVTTEEILKDLKTVPQQVWNKNYLAQFIPGQGSVFSNIRNCIRIISSRTKQDRFYYIGIDLGRLQDFTVITVIDSRTFEVVYWDRFRELDWVFQRKKILAVVDQFKNSKIFIDQTGLGQPILDELQNVGIFIEGIKFSSESKKDIVEKLALYLEHGMIAFPDIPELVKELEVFGYSMTKTGKIHYSAPSGFHDDCVISLALAVHGLQGNPNFSVNPNLTYKDLLHESNKTEINQMLSLEQKEINIMRPYV